MVFIQKYESLNVYPEILSPLGLTSFSSFFVNLVVSEKSASQLAFITLAVTIKPISFLPFELRRRVLQQTLIE